MGEPTQDRLATIRKLIEQAADEALDGLEAVVASQSKDDRSNTRVRELIAAEVLDRRLRNSVLHPFLPFFTPPHGVPRLGFPPPMLPTLWRAIRVASPELVADAMDMGQAFWSGPETPPVHDEICRSAAAHLQAGDDAFATLSSELAPNQRTSLATLLELAPLLRRCLPSLGSWLINTGREHDAAIRVAFKDADEMGEGAAFLFMEALFVHVEEPAQILQLISVVMDHPTERYVAASELASFGERLLDSIDASLERVRQTDLRRGLESGVAVASAAATASVRALEFEQQIKLAREGAWGARVAAQRRSLALMMEMRLREMEAAVSAALPAQVIRSGVKRLRGAAVVDAPPDPAAADRVLALLALLEGSRATAAQAGFATLRTKVVESLDNLLEGYIQELLDLLHRGGADGERAQNARAFLDLAAELLSLVRDPGAGELVRRRAAAA